MPGMTSPSSALPDLTVLLYSQDAAVRAQVRSAVGRRPAQDLGRIEWIECSRQDQVTAEIERGADLAIFDGEAQPSGGMGLVRAYKNEISDCPPIAVLVARAQDAWLATWSMADAVLVRPIDAVTVAGQIADLLRARVSQIPVVR
jgi:hypothetical protein